MMGLGEVRPAPAHGGWEGEAISIIEDQDWRQAINGIHCSAVFPTETQFLH